MQLGLLSNGSYTSRNNGDGMRSGDMTSLINLYNKQNVQYYARVTQRNMDWTKIELEKYWNSLIENVDIELDIHHFMNCVITKPNSNRGLMHYISITDGQQRMTVTALHICAICGFVKNNNIPKEEFDYEKIRNTLLINPNETGEDRYKLLLRKKDRDTLNMIIDELPSYLDKKTGSPKIITAYNYLYNKLTLDNYQEVYNKLFFMDTLDIIAEPHDDENIIYDSVNSSGRQLSNFDQIRAFVLGKYGLNEQEEINEKYWENISENKSPNTVMRAFNTYTSDVYIAGDIYSNFKRIALKYDSFDKLNNDVSDFYEAYRSFEKNTFDNEKLREIVKGLNLVTIASSYPAFIKMYNFYLNGEITEETLLNVFQLILNVCLRLKIKNKGTSYELRDAFELNIGWISSDNLYNKVYKKLSNLFISDNQFKMIISSKNFYKGNKDEFESENSQIPSNIGKLTDYLLLSIENAHYPKGRINPKKYSKEHICPQTLDNGWEHFFSPEDHHDYVHSLGNLTLTAYNSEYSNLSFKEKKLMENGFKDDKLYLNKCICSYTTWTVDSIKQRTELLADELCNIFAIPENSDVHQSILR